MLQRRLSAVVVAVTGLLVFVVLAAVVASGHAGGLDACVRRWVLTHRVPWLRSAARVVTDVLSPPVDAIVLAVVALVTARVRRSVAPVVQALAVLAVTAAVVVGMKYAVGRPAPFLAGSGSAGRSFPSGHTAATLAFLGAAVVVATRPGARRRRLLAGAVVLTVLCAACLVYADYHWLTDTVASVALGAAVLSALVATDPAVRQPAYGAAAATSFADTFAP